MDKIIAEIIAGFIIYGIPLSLIFLIIERYQQHKEMNKTITYFVKVETTQHRSKIQQLVNEAVQPLDHTLAPTFQSIANHVLQIDQAIARTYPSSGRLIIREWETERSRHISISTQTNQNWICRINLHRIKQN